MSLINIGVDTGFGYVMSSCTLGESRFSSYIKKVIEEDVNVIRERINKVSESTLLVKFDNSYYVMGSLCEKVYPKERRKISANRIGNEYHLVQLLTSICLSVPGQKEVNVNLMVGLPNKLRQEKGEFVEWLKGKKFTLMFLTSESETTRTIKIKEMECISQPSAALFTLDEEDREKKVISVDVGHSSTDGIYSSNLEVSLELGDQIALEGVMRCYNDLERRLINKYSKTSYKLTTVLDKDLQRAIETGYFSIHDERVDITGTLDDIYTDFADYIFDEVERKYSDYLTTTDIFLVSGGMANNESFMHQLGSKFKTYSVTVGTSDEPQWTICRGMKNLLSEIYDDDFTDAKPIEKENSEVAVTSE